GPRARARRRQHRGHGAVPLRGHELGRDLAVRRRGRAGGQGGGADPQARSRRLPSRMSGARFEPAGALRGELRAPPDKSVSHRAALIGAMADGPTRITGYLDSADTRATLRAVVAVGAEVREGAPDDHGGLFVEIEGIGLRGARPAEIDVG